MAMMTRKHLIIAGSLVLALPILFLAWGTLVSYPHWETGGRASVGLKAGMTEAEFVKHLETKSHVLGCVEGDCTVEPRGLARFSLGHLLNGVGPTVHFIYTVSAEFDSSGKLRTWNAGRYKI